MAIFDVIVHFMTISEYIFAYSARKHVSHDVRCQLILYNRLYKILILCVTCSLAGRGGANLDRKCGDTLAAAARSPSVNI